MKTLTESWWYKGSELPPKIRICKGSEIYILDEGMCLENIHIEKGAKLMYFWLFSSKSIQEHTYQKYFFLEGPQAICDVKILQVNSLWSLTSQVHIFEQASHTQAHTHIITFACRDTHTHIDALLSIDEGLQKVVWSLDQENIFLGESGKIGGMPALKVASDDVQVSHSCKMHTLSDEKLYYLKSRGIEHNDAESMMLRASIEKIFAFTRKKDKTTYANIESSILKDIFYTW